MEVNAIILAAGKGTRMKSELPKCAHYIIDKPMVEYVVDALKKICVEDVVTVVGYKKEVIQEFLKCKSRFVVQEEQLGTAHAVLMAENYFKDRVGTTIIAIGDMPFITKETYYQLLTTHLQSKSDVTVLTTEHPNPYGYGRIIRDECDQVLEIVEEKDCTKDQRSISEINSSVYAVRTEILFDLLKEIKNENNQQEYYLTDIVKVSNKRGLKVTACKVNDYKEISGVNDKFQLMEMEADLQAKILKKHLLKGVTIHNPATVVIGIDVKLRPGSELMPGSMVTGRSTIDTNAIIGPFTQIKDSYVGEGARVSFSYLEGCNIPSDSDIGPFVHMISNKIVNK